MEPWKAARLRDRVAPGVRVLLVGINPGVRSATLGHHFAGYSNRFWRLMHESGLVPEPIGFEDDVRAVGDGAFAGGRAGVGRGDASGRDVGGAGVHREAAERRDVAAAGRKV